ncbi:hypothetical protein CROQUDRAFT_660432 [Cronartium quercuum f. sp. fusiforme G11]|uniref:Uncharacterized protein n=1 Tax=Cronartium quercuum f. sp. fusiforme G11 TaxID=708437 RepID=A0A9P6NDF4_9BASI|nr:hypothetical protein CROQUDRAFT_660432 [Cronartium quercuum f. sp. fusiforme G11]
MPTDILNSPSAPVSAPEDQSIPTPASLVHEPLNPTSKAAQKTEKAYKKVLLQEAKGEEKKMKMAIKDGKSATKAEQKAAKQANKAKKELEKAVNKEYKLNKKFVAAKASHEKAVLDLEKAKSKAELKSSHHTTQLALRDQKMETVNTLRGRGSVAV